MQAKIEPGPLVELGNTGHVATRLWPIPRFAGASGIRPATMHPGEIDACCRPGDGLGSDRAGSGGYRPVISAAAGNPSASSGRDLLPPPDQSVPGSEPHAT